MYDYKNIIINIMIIYCLKILLRRKYILRSDSVFKINSTFTTMFLS